MRWTMVLTLLSALAFSQAFFDEDVPGNELKDDKFCPPCECECPSVAPDETEEEEADTV